MPRPVPSEYPARGRGGAATCPSEYPAADPRRGAAAATRAGSRPRRGVDATRRRHFAQLAAFLLPLVILVGKTVGVSLLPSGAGGAAGLLAGAVNYVAVREVVAGAASFGDDYVATAAPTAVLVAALVTRREATSLAQHALLQVAVGVASYALASTRAPRRRREGVWTSLDDDRMATPGG